MDKDIRNIREVLLTYNVIKCVKQGEIDPEKVKDMFHSSLKERNLLNGIIKFTLSKKDFNLELFKSQIKTLTNLNDKTEYISQLENISINWEPTENEIKAFHIVTKGELSDLEELFNNDSDIRMLVRNHNINLLHQAIHRKKYEIVEYLINKGASLSSVDSIGRNPLQVALLTNFNNNIVKLLISRGSPFPNEEIKYLVLNDVVKLQNIDLNKIDESGATPLHYLAASGNVKLLYLFENFDKIDSKIKDKIEFTCIDRASTNGHLQMVIELIRIFKMEMKYNDFLVSWLYNIIFFSNNIEILEWWFRSVENIPSNLVYRKSLINWVGGPSFDIITKKIKFLFSRGGSLKDVDRDGNNFLMVYTYDIISMPMNEQLLNYLIDNGLELSHKNKLDQSICHLGAAAGEIEVLKLALPYLSIEFFTQSDRQGYTPLMHAVVNGHLDTVKFLLSISDSYNLLNISSNLSLHDLALANGFRVIAKIFSEGEMKSNIAQYFNNSIEILKSDDKYHFHAHNIANISSKTTVKLDLQTEHIVKCVKVLQVGNIFRVIRLPFEEYFDDVGATSKCT